MTFSDFYPLIQNLCWFASIYFILKMGRNQFDYCVELQNLLINQQLAITDLNQRLSYIHKILFTSRQTTNNKIEILESDLRDIHNLLGMGPGQLFYGPKDEADKHESME